MADRGQSGQRIRRLTPQLKGPVAADLFGRRQLEVNLQQHLYVGRGGHAATGTLAAAAFAVYTGARRAECLGLRWPHVDFESNTVTIRRSLTRSPKIVVRLRRFAPPLRTTIFWDGRESNPSSGILSRSQPLPKSVILSGVSAAPVPGPSLPIPTVSAPSVTKCDTRPPSSLEPLRRVSLDRQEWRRLRRLLRSAAATGLVSSFQRLTAKTKCRSVMALS